MGKSLKRRRLPLRNVHSIHILMNPSPLNSLRNNFQKVGDTKINQLLDQLIIELIVSFAAHLVLTCLDYDRIGTCDPIGKVGKIAIFLQLTVINGQLT